MKLLNSRIVQKLLVKPEARGNIKYSTKSSSRNCPVSASVSSDLIGELRSTTAPWIRIGEFQKGLMSHLSTFEILRALFVLKLCSFDSFVDRSMGLIEMYKKLGKLAEWPVRKTFFNQFVGGDKIPKMKEAVDSMHNRGVRLMLCPVLEEDIEDERSPSHLYDNNMKALIDLVELTATWGYQKPMFHLKPTGIMPAITLEKISEAINRRCSYTEPDKLAKLIEEIADSIDNPSALTLKIPKEESKDFFEGLKRADNIIEQAKRFPVQVLVDAEFYSLKPGISAIALALMARHNGNGHFVGNTIQSYLKEAAPTIKYELDVVTRLIGVNWFGKIVRGAYMDRERKLAKKRGYDSPIWGTYEETNKSYNSCVKFALEYIAAGKTSNEPQTSLVVAGHNERSIRLAAQKMKDLEIAPEDDLVSFAQIYGMSDYLSSPLTEKGYSVYKSTPFGPIERVLPYLTRRASENRAVIQGAREEWNMLLRELKTRMSVGQ